jgi:ABC-2 type transport system permease protein
VIGTLRRKGRIFGALAALKPKLALTYRAWFWSSIVLNAIAMAIYVFFWRAVYANTPTIAGLDLQQTINYILLAQIFLPIGDIELFWEFGYNLREGQIAIELLRPVSMLANFYTQYMAGLFAFLIWNIPMALVATLFFGLHWPSDPAIWLIFLVTVVLARTVLYFFDWIAASLTFYTTEIWGLGILINGIGLFASGALLPLVMMPGWLQAILQSLPFAQVIYMPIALLTGILPASEAPRIWLVQLAWIAGLWLCSQALFKIAIRKVTVQGG